MNLEKRSKEHKETELKVFRTILANARNKLRNRAQFLEEEYQLSEPILSYDRIGNKKEETGQNNKLRILSNEAKMSMICDIIALARSKLREHPPFVNYGNSKSRKRIRESIFEDNRKKVQDKRLFFETDEEEKIIAPTVGEKEAVISLSTEGIDVYRTRARITDMEDRNSIKRTLAAVNEIRTSVSCPAEVKDPFKTGAIISDVEVDNPEKINIIPKAKDIRGVLEFSAESLGGCRTCSRLSNDPNLARSSTSVANVGKGSATSLSSEAKKAYPTCSCYLSVDNKNGMPNISSTGKGKETRAVLLRSTEAEDANQTRAVLLRKNDRNGMISSQCTSRETGTVQPISAEPKHACRRTYTHFAGVDDKNRKQSAINKESDTDFDTNIFANFAHEFEEFAHFFEEFEDSYKLNTLEKGINTGIFEQARQSLSRVSKEFDVYAEFFKNYEEHYRHSTTSKEHDKDIFESRSNILARSVNKSKEFVSCFEEDEENNNQIVTGKETDNDIFASTSNFLTRIQNELKKYSSYSKVHEENKEKKILPIERKSTGFLNYIETDFKPEISEKSTTTGPISKISESNTRTTSTNTTLGSNIVTLLNSTISGTDTGTSPKITFMESGTGTKPTIKILESNTKETSTRITSESGSQTISESNKKTIATSTTSINDNETIPIRISEISVGPTSGRRTLTIPISIISESGTELPRSSIIPEISAITTLRNITSASGSETPQTNLIPKSTTVMTSRNVTSKSGVETPQTSLISESTTATTSKNKNSGKSASPIKMITEKSTKTTLKYMFSKNATGKKCLVTKTGTKTSTKRVISKSGTTTTSKHATTNLRAKIIPKSL